MHKRNGCLTHEENTYPKVTTLVKSDQLDSDKYASTVVKDPIFIQQTKVSHSNQIVNKVPCWYNDDSVLQISDAPTTDNLCIRWVTKSKVIACADDTKEGMGNAYHSIARICILWWKSFDIKPGWILAAKRSPDRKSEEKDLKYRPENYHDSQITDHGEFKFKWFCISRWYIENCELHF